MNAMSPVPKNHPLMLAWEAHKQTEEYANSKKWAVHPQHIDGSLWALFEAGWRAAQPAQSVDVAKVKEVIADLRHEQNPTDPAFKAWADKLTAALMGKPPEQNAPQRAVVLVAKIDADTRRDLADHLRNLALDIERDKSFGVSISGGYSSGHIVHLYTDEHPTRNEYFAALNSWLEQQSSTQDKTP